MFLERATPSKTSSTLLIKAFVKFVKCKKVMNGARPAIQSRDYLHFTHGLKGHSIAIDVNILTASSGHSIDFQICR
jgi:hypothetical protein